MKTSYRAAVHDFSVMNSVLIVLEDENGTRGIGTADPSPGYSQQTAEEIWTVLSNSILPSLLKKQPETPSKAEATLDKITEHANAKCAAEIAYLDLFSRLHENPISSYLGGRQQNQEYLNAWIGVDNPNNMAAEAKKWRDRGFKSLKLKLSGNAATDISRVRTVLDAVSETMQVRADVNGAYDTRTAIRVAQELEDTSLAHLEQPVPEENIDGLQAVTNSSQTTIVADECLTDLSRVREVLEREASDRLKLKPLRLGGLLKTKRALTMSSNQGKDCIVGHGFGLMPATSAELQLTASHKNVFRPVESVGLLKMKEEPFIPDFSYESGQIQLSLKSGLGVDLHKNQLDKFAEKCEKFEI